MRHWRAVLWMLSLAACSGSTLPDGPVQFTASPLQLSQVAFIAPLGNLNPPGHTLPSDHIYFYFVDPDHCPAPCDVASPRPVYAVADGKVQTIQHGSDDALYVQSTGSVQYYFGHLLVAAGITQGAMVRAGDQVGVTSGQAFALDLGVVNTAVTQAFVAPQRYPDPHLHGDKPLTYYSDPLRSQLYGLVRRSGADKDGTFMYDQAGRLIGNWFLQDLPSNSTSFNFENGPKHLSFQYDSADPTRSRVAIGGTIDTPGVWALAAGDPATETITPASGAITLHLQYTGVANEYGRLLVQLMDASTLKVEKFFPGTGALTFDGGARIYVR